MTEKKEKACNHLLLVCKRVQRRLNDGYAPTFEQMEHLDGAIDALEAELVCGHKIVDECECFEETR
jgi:hypothetical protein